ncbi:MAG: TonB-dependent receptor [Planctomycetes bacterium]|nr:TonB-dependent receptor [Planctomycetota bacterium]
MKRPSIAWAGFGFALLAPCLPAQTPPPATGQLPPPAEGAASASSAQPQNPPARGAGLGADGDERVVVTASRAPEPPFEAAVSVAVIGATELFEREYRTIPQALRDVPGVIVQETSTGQGSPYIRGFTGFQNLFLIDGVRLNNSVFRSGPNQYWSTVDGQSIERLELVKGPNSVLYGADAIGGTVQVITRGPTHARAPGLRYGGRTFLRYSTAEDSLIGRAEFDVGFGHDDGASTALLVGATIKRFGDLEAGGGTGEQPGTGYGEDDFDLRLEHRFDKRWRAVVMHQRVDQDDVPRTHATVDGISWYGTSVGSDLQRQYDQRRTLTYAQLHGEDLGGTIDALHVSVSLHSQDEIEDRIRGDGSQQFQGFEVDSYGLWAQLESDTAAGRLTYGVEWYRDRVDSFFRRVGSAPRPGDEIQGPVADDATYDLFAAYLQDRVEIDDRLTVTLGGRYNYAAADADSVRDAVSNTRISLSDSWSDFVFSLHARYELVPEQVAMFGGVSQGFRAPNLSDLSRFDSARSNEFEVPSPGLDAERYLSYELGTKVRTDRVSFEGAVFYTDIQDQILRFPTGVTNASGEVEVAKGNVGDGDVYGVELGGAWRPADAWTVFGNLTWMEGRVDNFETSLTMTEETWLTRLMPLTWQLGLRWDEVESGRFWLETRIVRAEEADRLSFSDRRDTQRIPPGGTPGYTLWDLAGGFRVDDDTTLVVRLDNVTDANYRVHGSGSNSPGRNLVVAVECRF